ncbi:Zn-ribbon domain-containing OB-fold protein [Actinoplanes regularis]|uniref:DUF35 domain-containing protein n=1 Tax=Actinoplanes regularis TaxID=52697 RepID=A0A238ZRI9_9ACTN|nr:OB-fold domain-containing protein [Actinoplanes regularis]GIE90318.1 hypothetical protein Are01nite_67980 [Actinoplanes regularis]SNR85960.1 hypothetical protein SAMN06264365_106252 [Actinoplanes regularis]
MIVIQKCLACDRWQHPGRPICLTCGDAENLGDAPVTGNGNVDSFTVVHRAAAPYIVARIRLVEGPIVLGHLADNPEPRCDQPVRFVHRDPLPVWIPGHHHPPSTRSR